MRFGLFLTGILVLLTAGIAHGQATTAPSTPPPAAEFRDGKWQSIKPVAAAPAPTNDPELDHAMQLLQSNDPSAAETVCLYWIKTHGAKAPGRDRAIFLLARAKYGVNSGDDGLYAFYYCDELLDEYPDSKYFQPALEFQYKIADGYLNGRKRKFLGLPIVPSDEEAIEMLYRIQQRAPGSVLAENCLLRSADYYYAQGDYDLAHDAYGVYVKAYPRAKKVPQAKLRMAFASLAQFRGVRFDPTSLLNARAELVDFATGYPDLAAKEDVNGIIVRIDQALARKIFVTAEFYQRTHADHGAVYMYRYLILTFPNAADVPAARAALENMPKSALADAEPKPGAEYTPPVDPLDVGGGVK